MLMLRGLQKFKNNNKYILFQDDIYNSLARLLDGKRVGSGAAAFVRNVSELLGRIEDTGITVGVHDLQSCLAGRAGESVPSTSNSRRRRAEDSLDGEPPAARRKVSIKSFDPKENDRKSLVCLIFS